MMINTSIRQKVNIKTLFVICWLLVAYLLSFFSVAKGFGMPLSLVGSPAGDPVSEFRSYGQRPGDVRKPYLFYYSENKTIDSIFSTIYKPLEMAAISSCVFGKISYEEGFAPIPRESFWSMAWEGWGRLIVITIVVAAFILLIVSIRLIKINIFNKGNDNG